MSQLLARAIFYTVFAIGLVSSFNADAQIYKRLNLIDPFSAAELYVMAHSLTRLPIPDMKPTINSVPRAKLRDRFCPASNKNCGIFGHYWDGVVYIDDQLDVELPLTRSIILHELIHHLQARASADHYQATHVEWTPAQMRGDAVNCEEWLAREIQAYTIQKQVLNKVNVLFNPPRLPRCI